jgi:tetraacyldisaccharide 4'-kinase
LCGIANPDAFRRSVESMGAVVVAERVFKDHHRYRARDLRGLSARVPLWITTEKDAVKIPSSWSEGSRGSKGSGGLDLRVLSMELAADDGDELTDWVEARISAWTSARLSE